MKWVEVKSKEAVQKGLNNQEYYAALVIPKEFSTKQASLRTPQPSSPEVEIFINQGNKLQQHPTMGRTNVTGDR